MEVHDINALLGGLPTVDLARRPTREEAMAAAPVLAAFHGCEARLARFSGQPPWERHAADELIYVLEGEVEMRVALPDEIRSMVLRAGSFVVMPARTWHSSNARERVTILAVTPVEGNEASVADDPRTEN